MNKECLVILQKYIFGIKEAKNIVKAINVSNKYCETFWINAAQIAVQEEYIFKINCFFINLKTNIIENVYKYKTLKLQLAILFVKYVLYCFVFF